VSDVRIIDRIRGIGTEILIVTTEFGQQAFHGLFHFVSTVVGTDRNSSADLRVSGGYALKDNVPLAREIRGERRDQGAFADPQRRTDAGVTYVVFGNDGLVRQIAPCSTSNSL